MEVFHQRFCVVLSAFGHNYHRVRFSATVSVVDCFANLFRLEFDLRDQNQLCTTGDSGNLTYQSDFTILEGRKYKHSSNPSQEFSFSYDPNTQVVTWLDGPNAGTVGAYYLPDGAQPYRIIEQFPNNPQSKPVSCKLAETK